MDSVLYCRFWRLLTERMFIFNWSKRLTARYISMHLRVSTSCVRYVNSVIQYRACMQHWMGMLPVVFGWCLPGEGVTMPRLAEYLIRRPVTLTDRKDNDRMICTAVLLYTVIVSVICLEHGSQRGRQSFVRKAPVGGRRRPSNLILIPPLAEMSTVHWRHHSSGPSMWEATSIQPNFDSHLSSSTVHTEDITFHAQVNGICLHEAQMRNFDHYAHPHGWGLMAWFH